MICWAINPYDFEFKLGIPKNLNLEFKLFFQIKMTIFDSSSSDSEVDSDFDACIRGLASLSRLNKHRNSIGRGRGRGRGRGEGGSDGGTLGDGGGDGFLGEVARWWGRRRCWRRTHRSRIGI
jgi:hypothetical protein